MRSGRGWESSEGRSSGDPSLGYRPEATACSQLSHRVQLGPAEGEVGRLHNRPVVGELHTVLEEAVLVGLPN